MKEFTLITGMVTLAFAGTAMAQDHQKEYWSDGGGLIPDNDPNGLRVEIFVPHHQQIISFDSLRIDDFSHTWAGDLQIFLTHKDTGTTVTLLDRPGVPESTFGDSADFAGEYTWQDGGFVYDADIYDTTVPNADPFGPVAGMFSDFVGEDKYGTWSLLIVDNAGGDTGSIGMWHMVITNPSPGALALLGVAGLFGTRRRR